MMGLSAATDHIDVNAGCKGNIRGSTEMSSSDLCHYSESENGEFAVQLPHMDIEKPLENGARDWKTNSDSDEQQPLLSPTSYVSYFFNHKPTNPNTPPPTQVCESFEASPSAVPQARRGNQGIKAARRRFLLEKSANLQEAMAAFEDLKIKDQTIEASTKSSVTLCKRSGTLKTSKSTSSTFMTLAQQKPAPQPVNFLSTQSVHAKNSTVITTMNDGVHNQSCSHGRLNVPFQHPAPQPPKEASATSMTTGRNHKVQTGWADGGRLSIKVFDLPDDTTTRDVWAAFNHEGHITYIRLYEKARGFRDGKATIVFSPPPVKPFWNCTRYPMQIVGGRRIFVRVHNDTRQRLTPPGHLGNKYPDAMAMYAESLDFGMMFDQTTMMNMRQVRPLEATRIKFCMNMLHKEIYVEFPIQVVNPRTASNNPSMQGGKYDRTELFQFRIPLTQLKVIHQIEGHGHELNLLFSMEIPPKFFKQLDPSKSHDDRALVWGENDSWYRQTDLVYAPNGMKKTSLTWRKINPVIDLGRWTTYLLVFKNTEAMLQFNLMRQALREYNIEVLPFNEFCTTPRRDALVWEIIDLPLEKRNGSGTGLEEMVEASKPRMAFEVRYQLEVCLSQGFLNEHSLSEDFIRALLNMNTKRAQDLLEHIANHGTRVYDPMVLIQAINWHGSLSRTKIPSYCAYVRSATVTPTTVYFQTPIAETSNRVIRQYPQYADRFLRVRFTEEKTEGKIYPTHKDTMNEVFTRVKRVLTNGIRIGDRTYEFLACGNSQFREHGAYFFAPLPNLSTEKIRTWMGMFRKIKTVALYTSRLGQCFSTTRAIHGAWDKPVEIPDIKRNGFNFTDGVGRISPFLAHLAASELGILQHSQEPPSVFQIRVGGCKGVLAVSPDSAPGQIHIRRSQYKFPAMHESLEIIRWSQYASANLNRQLILILSALGVPDQVFAQKLQSQLSQLELAMTDETIALSILQKEIDHNQMTLTVASLILDGFQRTREPFVISLLQLWRAWSIKYLKEKARITISAGALLLGCVDETATLRGHFNNAPRISVTAPNDEKAKHVPQVFVQVTNEAGGMPEVMIGPMLLARNPSLHPGDIRVVCGVDVPQLRHLKDVVVLPQTGDRDLASMCSGGDLDGDDFLIIWDQDLLPREWNHEPMDYSRPPMEQLKENIGIDDLTTFFVTYMKNDTLPAIAKAHEANADYLEQGVKDVKCLKLASLHSMAVDYVKTGQPAHLSCDLKPPKWPHFMEKKGKQPHQIYTSKKILGQLYDQVERIDFVPAFNAPFDTRILQAYELDEGILQSAREIKDEYDAHMRRIMAQQEIRTEFEVWSTFVLQHSNTNNNFKYHEQIGEISMALKDQFRLVCYERAGGKDYEHIGPFAAAMYEVTAMELNTALDECRVIGGQRQPLREMTVSNMPLMSFPWLFQDVLGKIAKSNASENVDTFSIRGESGSKASVQSDTIRASQPRQNYTSPSTLSPNYYLKTSDGTARPGELLKLFEESREVGEDKEPAATGDIPSNLISFGSGDLLVDISVRRGFPASEELTNHSSSSSTDLLVKERYERCSHNTEVSAKGDLNSTTSSTSHTDGCEVPLSSKGRTEVVELTEKENIALDAVFERVFDDDETLNVKPDYAGSEGSNLRLLNDIKMDLPARTDNFGDRVSKILRCDESLAFENVSLAEKKIAERIKPSIIHVNDEVEKDAGTEKTAKEKDKGNHHHIKEFDDSNDSDVESDEVALCINDNARLLDELERVAGGDCTSVLR